MFWDPRVVLIAFHVDYVGDPEVIRAGIGELQKLDGESDFCFAFYC